MASLILTESTISYGKQMTAIKPVKLKNVTKDVTTSRRMDILFIPSNFFLYLTYHLEANVNERVHLHVLQNILLMTIEIK